MPRPRKPGCHGTDSRRTDVGAAVSGTLLPMARASGTLTNAERLVQELAGGSSDDELARWLAASRRFRAFAETHRDKIRKKLRGAGDSEGRHDVRAELRVAHLLLADARIDLAFEAYGSGKPGPDFTVSFRGERPFNLEVTRPRRASDVGGAAATILAKLRQLPPSVGNVLVSAIQGRTAEALDVEAAVQSLRERAIAQDDAFFSRGHLAGARDFGRRYRRLSAVVVWAEDAVGDERAAAWVNPSARIAVAARALNACVACLRAT